MKMMLFLLVIGLIGLCFGADSFTVSGNKIMKNGEWVVFNGISLECTEYFLRTNLGPLWGIKNCFGGPSHEVNGQYWAIQLNDEPQHVADLLTKSFSSTNTISRVDFKSPYDQVIDKTTPNRHPLIRLPTTASTYLYDADCVTGNATDYVETIDMIIQNFTSQGIAVSYDYHWSCPQPSGLDCAGLFSFIFTFFKSDHPRTMDCTLMVFFALHVSFNACTKYYIYFS